jgi:hypothetical protein
MARSRAREPQKATLDESLESALSQRPEQGFDTPTLVVYREVRKPLPGDFTLEIRRARLDSLVVYDVTESELGTLELGSPDSIFLNFAVFLLSSAIAFIIALLTTEVRSPYVFLVFVTFIFVALVASGVLLCLWRTSRRSVSTCARIIRGRLPPEGT